MPSTPKSTTMPRIVRGIATACLTAMLAPHAPADEAALVLHYTFDEGSGSKLKDGSGHGNVGRIHGAKWIKAGRGYALQFDGIDDWVDCGRGDSLNLTGPLTIEAWVRPNARPQTEVGVVGKSFGSYALTVYKARNAYFYISKGANSCKAAIAVDRWQHLAATFDGARLKTYLNGVLRESRASRFKKVNPGERLLLGCIAKENQPQQPETGRMDFFEGAIAEVRIYRRALSDQEILQHVVQDAAGYDLAASWSLPADPQSLARRKAQMKEEGRANLALGRNGCWVITSSNANFDNLYSDNLIDDKAGSAWRSYQKTTEEWAELKWDLPMLVDTVKVMPHEQSGTDRMTLYAWLEDRWKPVGEKAGDQLKGGSVVFRFETVRAGRFRLVLSSAEPGYSGLWEIQAFGPPQPIVTLKNSRGRWKYVTVSGSARAAKGQTETLVVEQVRLDPASVKPGDHLKLICRVKPPSKLRDDYVLVATFGQRERYFNRADYTVTREVLRPDSPPSAWPAGAGRTIETDVYIPKYAPDGWVDVMLHAADRAGQPPLKLVDSTGNPLDDGKVARLDVRRFASRPPPDRKKHVTRIDTSNGGTVISIDGKKIAPILFALQTPSLERFHLYSQVAGVKLYHLQIYPYRIDTGDYQARNYAFVEGHIRQMLRIDPQAYAIIQMDLRTTPAWREQHPGSSLITHDGRKMHESFCSKEYRRELRSYVSNLVKFVQSKPWGNRVIGYLCEIGEPEGVLSGGYDIGDYNPQAIEAFRDFLRRRYGGSVERLRKAYNDPELTFEKVYPDHARIMEAGADGGCFLDPLTQRLTIDYHEFLASIIPTRLMEECGGTIKRLTGNRVLVGSYWAYLLEDITAGQGSHQMTHSYLHHVLASPNLDFFASPFNYWVPSRHAGDPYLPFQPYDALRINGKLHIPEMDHRTFRVGQLDRGRNYSQAESVALIRRDLGTALMHGMGAWMSDWSNNDRPERRYSEPYFTDSKILEQVNALREAYQKSIDLDRRDTPQVAAFVSGTSYYYHDNNARPIYADLIRTTLYYNMNMTGVPYDILLFEDLLKAKVQRGYKCFVLLNPFYMTERQRRVVQSLKRDGNTIVSIYAPGYVRDTGLSPDNIREITGFAVQADHQSQRLTYRIAPSDHPIVQGLPDEPYGGRAGPVSPRFFVTDADPQTAVLGTYPDGKAAFVARDFGTHKSVYCAVPYLPVALLRNIFRYAGCHIYVDQDLYIDATKNHLMLTNSFKRPRTLTVRLPAKRNVFELLSGRPVAKDAAAFEVHIAPGRTLLYRLK